jgi:hypothetical protein
VGRWLCALNESGNVLVWDYSHSAPIYSLSLESICAGVNFTLGNTLAQAKFEVKPSEIRLMKIFEFLLPRDASALSVVTKRVVLSFVTENRFVFRF